MENKIYKEAILDAKALRASAIANAKSMMQEAIEPAIQEMMRLKLSEELEEDTLEEELEETYEEGYEDKDHTNMEEGNYEEGEEHQMEEEVSEATLEEILAELEALEEDETLNEAEEEEEEAEEDEETEEVEDETEEGEVDDDTKVVQLTLGDLKAALFPQMAGAEGGEDSEQAAVSLDEILAELEEKEHGKTEEGKEQINEGDPSILIGGLVGLGLGLSTLAPYAIAKIKPYIAKLMGKPTVSDEEIKNLDAEALKGLMGSRGKLGEMKKDHKMEEELEMAKETIQTLQESIKEINLLNAKLLYMNKIFKAKSLTESEKIKVVKAFDRNTNVKEVKNTYETLKESFQAKKTQIKESVGFASKPIGSVAKNNIIEADPFINRWQKIAGIK